MSDIATKLQYLNTTKSKIKDVINMTGVGITNDTFRSYAQSLYNGYIATLQDKGTLLDNMNKGTSTGTISDSANLPVCEYKASKLSTQDGTPTPDNPVEVKTVKGYRNLFDKDNANYVEGYIKINGVDTRSEFSGYLNSYIPVLPNTIYTLQGSLTTVTNGARLYFYDSSKNWIDRSNVIENNNFPYTFTTPNNCYFLQFQYTMSAYNGNDVQLNEGSMTLPYVPYGTNYIYTTITGKNIWNEQWQLGNINNDTGALENANNYIRSKTYILIEANTTYYRTPTANELTRMFFYNSNKQFISSAVVPQNGGTFTTPNNAKYMLFKKFATTYSNDIAIIKGNSGTYEAYKERIITIPLNGNEVCGIGAYLDEIVIDKYGHAKLNKKIGKVVLDGTQGLLLRNTSANGTYTYSLNTPFEYKIEENASILSNYFNSLGTVIGVSKMYDDYLDILGIALYYNSSSLSTRVVYINSNVDLTTWLSTHNTDVYYVLATSTEIDLGTLDMELYEGTNNITNSEDMDMSIRFIKSDFE